MELAACARKGYRGGSSRSHLVTGTAQRLDGFLKAVGRDEDEVFVVAACGPDRKLGDGERLDDGAEHARRVGVVRVISVPHRYPGVLGRVVAPHHRTPSGPRT